MVMRASEARKQAEEINLEEYSRLIDQIDSGIEKAVYEGNFHYTTKALTVEVSNKIIPRYEELGYEVIHCGNHQYKINW